MVNNSAVICMVGLFGSGDQVHVSQKLSSQVNIEATRSVDEDAAALIFQTKTNIKTQVNLIVYLPTPEALIRNNHTLVPLISFKQKESRI
jgi:hypothetical protein